MIRSSPDGSPGEAEGMLQGGEPREGELQVGTGAWTAALQARPGASGLKDGALTVCTLALGVSSGVPWATWVSGLGPRAEQGLLRMGC